MSDDRFEAWWPRNPARLEMNPVAKEVARGIWRAARADILDQLRDRAANGQPAQPERGLYESATAFEERYAKWRREVLIPPAGAKDKGVSC